MHSRNTATVNPPFSAWFESPYCTQLHSVAGPKMPKAGSTAETSGYPVLQWYAQNQMLQFGQNPGYIAFAAKQEPQQLETLLCARCKSRKRPLGMHMLRKAVEPSGKRYSCLELSPYGLKPLIC